MKIERTAVVVKILIAVLFWPWFAARVLAVEPTEVLADPALESRAREISQQLRCVVCQNQSIDDSNAELARDLRLLVRERLVAGDTDEAVMNYIVERYGDFVLLRPPIKPSTYPLWLAPPLFLAVGVVLALGYLRNRRGRGATPSAPLSAEEQIRLNQLINSDAET